MPVQNAQVASAVPTATPAAMDVKSSPASSAGVSVKNAIAAQTKPLTMDDLTPVEQAAAHLGVDPDGIKPISWLNAEHFNNLKEKNSISTELNRRIDAFKHLSEVEGKVKASA